MEDQFTEIPHVFNPSKPQRRLPRRTIVLLTIIVLLLITFIFIRFTSSKKPNTSVTSTVTSPSPTASAIEQTPSPSPSGSPTPTPTVSPVDKKTGLDRSKLSVSVENGSGGAGVAGKAADFLKGLGYDVVSTSNADSFSYSGVVIQIKSEKSDYLNLLKNDLGQNYTIGTTSAELSSSASEDVLVIIGQ